MADQFGLGAASFLKGLAGGIQQPKATTNSDSTMLNFLMRMQQQAALAQENELNRQLRRELAGADKEEQHKKARIQAITDAGLWTQLQSWDSMSPKDQKALGQKINAVWKAIDTSYRLKGGYLDIPEIKEEPKKPVKGFDIFGQMGKIFKKGEGKKTDVSKLSGPFVPTPEAVERRRAMGQPDVNLLENIGLALTQKNPELAAIEELSRPAESQFVDDVNTLNQSGFYGMRPY